MMNPNTVIVLTVRANEWKKQLSDILKIVLIAVVLCIGMIIGCVLIAVKKLTLMKMIMMVLLKDNNFKHLH